MGFKDLPHAWESFDVRVSPEIKDRLSGPPMGPEEWANLRANSYERHRLMPILTDDVFLSTVDQAICNSQQLLFWQLADHYDQWLSTHGIQELLRRFRKLGGENATLRADIDSLEKERESLYQSIDTLRLAFHVLGTTALYRANQPGGSMDALNVSDACTEALNAAIQPGPVEQRTKAEAENKSLRASLERANQRIAALEASCPVWAIENADRELADQRNQSPTT